MLHGARTWAKQSHSITYESTGFTLLELLKDIRPKRRLEELFEFPQRREKDNKTKEATSSYEENEEVPLEPTRKSLRLQKRTLEDSAPPPSPLEDRPQKELRKPSGRTV
uniref:Uncharacterized protein n=1 Tax=Timema tahoe TaxID=61484 RepID=A0A7R9FM09_9NEOP|nr:unnamed protein product [Timema tahoe]